MEGLAPCQIFTKTFFKTTVKKFSFMLIKFPPPSHSGIFFINSYLSFSQQLTSSIYFLKLDLLLLLGVTEDGSCLWVMAVCSSPVELHRAVSSDMFVKTRVGR